MSVHLSAIKFNHDPTSMSNDALNIRRNFTEPVTVPEWHRVMTKPEESVAAYAIRETQGNTLTIQALFGCTDPQITTVEVRAIQPLPPPPPAEWWQLWLRLLEAFPWLWHLLIYLAGMGYGKNVLGEVRARKVEFKPDGESEFVSFELNKHWVDKRGVGVHTVTWDWQWRLKPTDPWTTFWTSHHRIYTLLQVPQPPWQQTPYSDSNTQLPWSEVLDHACLWAAYATTTDDAATLVTRSLNAKGPAVLTYSGSGHWYSDSSYFDCTGFLDLLDPKSKIPKPDNVDCSDCATILSTFANILGCELSQSQMNDPYKPKSSFFTNPILSIGSIGVAQMAPTKWNYHEVAWTGGGGSNDNVYDASLHLNGNPNPANQPYTELLPTNMRFGEPNDGDYRDKLAAVKPDGNRAKCYPKQKPIRRKVR